MSRNYYCTTSGLVNSTVTQAYCGSKTQGDEKSCTMHVAEHHVQPNDEHTDVNSSERRVECSTDSYAERRFVQFADSRVENLLVRWVPEVCADVSTHCCVSRWTKNYFKSCGSQDKKFFASSTDGGRTQLDAESNAAHQEIIDDFMDDTKDGSILSQDDSTT